MSENSNKYDKKGFGMVEIPHFSDSRGSLSYAEWRHLPFEPKRIFWIYDVGEGKTRGGHAHSECAEVVFAINGSFDILPRMKGFNFINWHPMKLTIHQAIYPIGQGPENVDATLRQAYDSVMSSLAHEYQGYIENPDQ